MKQKLVKTYVYEGFGFPVKLTNVTMVFIENDWHLKIDIQKVAADVIQQLATQEQRLTGSQLKFIRQFFAMSLREFAKKIVNESHTAVNKWEKCQEKVTTMDPNIEKIIRLYILERLAEKQTKLRKDFFVQYKRLSAVQWTNKDPGLVAVACHT